MAILAKSGRRACLFKALPFGMGAGRSPTIACLVLMLVFGCTGIARQGAAMFVSPPKEGKLPSIPTKSPAPSTREKKAAPPRPEQKVPAPGALPEDIELRMHIHEILPVPVEKRKVNSRAFARMSGQIQDLRPVAVPLSPVESKQPSPSAFTEPPDPTDSMLKIGSWLFVIACLAAAAIGLLRIKKLTSSD